MVTGDPDAARLFNSKQNPNDPSREFWAMFGMILVFGCLKDMLGTVMLLVRIYWRN